MLKAQAQAQDKLRGDTIIRINQTRGRSKTSWASTVATFVKCSGVKGTFPTVELLLQAAVRHMESVNGSTITTERESLC